MATKKTKTKNTGGKGKKVLGAILAIGAGVGAGRGLNALSKADFVKPKEAGKKNYIQPIIEGGGALVMSGVSVFVQNELINAPLYGIAAVMADHAVSDAIAVNKGLTGLGNADPFNLYEDMNNLDGAPEGEITLSNTDAPNSGSLVIG